MPSRSDPLALVRALRMSAQRLARPAPDPLAAVGELLAIQAQDHDGSLWSIGVRTARPDRAAVEAALDSGDLVRSWPMRGTLHLIRTDDLRPLLELTRERTTGLAASLHRREGITADDLGRALDATRSALAGARLPRRELIAAIAAGGTDVSGQRGAHLIVRLAQDGVLVHTGPTGFALASELLPDSEPMPRGDALAWLARRYVAGHGPVPARDLAWWAGLTLTDARAAFDAIRAEVDAIDVDGVEYLHSRGLEPVGPAVLALSGFDEWMLGYGDRRVALGDEPLTRVVPGSNGLFLPTIVIDGRVAATWRRVRGAASDSVEITPWRTIRQRRMPAVRRAIRERIGFDGRIAVLAD